MKKVLITGAQLVNRGAQSMLFITTCELKKRFGDCCVYFATNQDYNESEYAFTKVFDSTLSKKIAVGNVKKSEIKSLLRNIINLFRGKNNTLVKFSNIFRFNDIKKLLPQLDLIIDVSGFALGKQWSVGRQEDYLLNIEMAKKYNIPMILMPQSFGPFDESADNLDLMNKIRDLLSYPDLIFARETEGYNILVNEFKLTNVKPSNDLVLQNKKINKDLIFNNHIELDTPQISENAVAIIPNIQCIYHKDESILVSYDVIIDTLLQENANIYIFWHSREDKTICESIYKKYESNSNVNLLTNDFSCLEYDELVKKFNFIICSRYHGIVHAYRNYIPAIILGWAVKYTELADRVGQSQYVFDITNPNIDLNKMKNVIQKMLHGWSDESEIIKSNVKQIQSNSCFDFLDRYK